MFLTIVDAHSKWPEMQIMSFTTSTQTIDRLRTTFSRYGVPVQVVTYNGPQFTSAEFQLFLKTNGIKHITTAYYHPANNGTSGTFCSEFQTCYEKRETKYIPAENQYGKVPFGLPECPAFDDWRITVCAVFGQTATDSPRFGES
jgi:transposase InsO family protein